MLHRSLSQALLPLLLGSGVHALGVSFISPNASSVWSTTNNTVTINVTSDGPFNNTNWFDIRAYARGGGSSYVTGNTLSPGVRSFQYNSLPDTQLTAGPIYLQFCQDKTCVNTDDFQYTYKPPSPTPDPQSSIGSPASVPSGGGLSGTMIAIIFASCVAVALGIAGFIYFRKGSDDVIPLKRYRSSSSANRESTRLEYPVADMAPAVPYRTPTSGPAPASSSASVKSSTTVRYGQPSSQRTGALRGDLSEPSDPILLSPTTLRPVQVQSNTPSPQAPTPSLPSSSNPRSYSDVRRNRAPSSVYSASPAMSTRRSPQDTSGAPRKPPSSQASR
ncbi:uncharacterized protein BJ171DRAFT_100543 [Polychytrium aggregatum]|uniref:uncharacterized protein n=1 Tax=Polychytrium aggregatum TaxID=110093 RepID=UPI0022FF07C5|nr:uncharacterized protein BJ171DRAFT_100543 [Polychytrium aggregatum]KAI9204740.1 hypothetical protein BJ171DRAFT_100543 [Polychytrium aggregatum]